MLLISFIRGIKNRGSNYSWEIEQLDRLSTISACYSISGVVSGPVPRKIQQVEKSVSIKIMNYRLPKQFHQVLHNWYSKFCSLFLWNLGYTNQLS